MWASSAVEQVEEGATEADCKLFNAKADWVDQIGQSAGTCGRRPTVVRRRLDGRLTR